MRDLRSLVHLALLAAAVLVFMSAPAGAAWTVSNPQYDYNNSSVLPQGIYGQAYSQG